MEVYEIIFIVIITAISIYLAFLISQNLTLLQISREHEILRSIDINVVTRYLWKTACSNSTEYTLNSNELIYLSRNYKCSVLPCLINISSPVLFIVNSSGSLYEFGICSKNREKCNERKSYILIDNTKIAELYTLICYDDLSMLTSVLQYNCNLNRSFKFSFSSSIKNLTIKNNTICLDSICNKIFCEKFLENYEFSNISLILFEINNDFYKVFKIS